MKDIKDYLDMVIVRPINETWTKWELVVPIHIKVKGLEIEIPESFQTDIASVPKIFWNILPPFGRYGIAAIVHDYLYSREDISKELADEIFYELMIESEVSKWKAKLMYLAAKYFGKKSKKSNC